MKIKKGKNDEKGKKTTKMSMAHDELSERKKRVDPVVCVVLKLFWSLMLLILCLVGVVQFAAVLMYCIAGNF